ncbi:MAG: biotin-dependent carboxyltransferase family protein, partial [Spirochaetaceae bacterium]|nr:biotin-dependent carboxyltransferase family protein [Spirochaetaceae bacterium]
SGFSPSGALDGFSFRLANFLTANAPGEAALEMTLRGASMVFDGPAVIAVTGADMTPLLNGFPAAMNKAFAVVRGDILHTGFALAGVRSYLAVSGGFDIEPVLGSRSTNLRVRAGGFEGRKLTTKDHIPFRETVQRLPGMERRFFDPGGAAFGKALDVTVRAAYAEADPLVLRIVEGKHAGRLSEDGIHRFYHSLYTVGTESDRMGVRLKGPAAASLRGADIVSSGVAPGSVQIPGSGQPIVLLNDRQTTGGYVTMGAVITGDLWRLAQAPADSAVRFEKIRAPAAEKIYRQTEREIARLGRRFVRPRVYR